MKLILALSISGCILFSCKGSQNPPDAGHTDTIPANPGNQYSCPMHPAIHSDTAGVCPECGMTLELRI